MNEISLISGDKMPALGLGTWQLTGEDCTQAVETALAAGYRHIDTAKIYGNHREVARGIRNSSVPVEDIFITSKIWNDCHEYDKVIASGQEIVRELKVDCLDLLLVHWPVEEVPVEETLAGLDELLRQGITRNIGLSNFTTGHLEEVFAKSKVAIANNQVKMHPYRFDRELNDLCRSHRITVTSYSPLARGKIFNDPSIRSLAGQIGRSPAQLVLRWLVEQGTIVIPKASSREHIEANMDIFDWSLPSEVRTSMDRIAETGEDS